MEYLFNGEARDAAIAQGAWTEFHAALHPGDDFVIFQRFDGALDEFPFGEQILKTQLAIFENAFDFAGA